MRYGIFFSNSYKLGGARFQEKRRYICIVKLHYNIIGFSGSALPHVYHLLVELWGLVEMWGLPLLSATDVGFTTLKRRIYLLRCEEISQKLWYKGLGLMS